MILAVSTSSPWTSIALLSQDGAVLASGRELAPRSASTAAISLASKLLAQQGLKLGDIEQFAADVGPGSFTGVKVGVTLAKTWAYAHHKPVAAISAFDLISTDQPAAIPIRRGVSFGRDSNGVRQISEEETRGFVGYAEGCREEIFPDAERVQPTGLEPLSPFALTAEYQIAPSISQAKRPLIMGDPNG